MIILVAHLDKSVYFTYSAGIGFLYIYIKLNLKKVKNKFPFLERKPHSALTGFLVGSLS